MKKILIITGIIVSVMFAFIFYLANNREKPCSNCEKNSQTEKTQETRFSNYFKDEADLCTVLSTEIVSNLLNQTVIKTNPATSNKLHSCQYYLNDNQAIIINYDTLSIANQKQGHEIFDRKIITNPKIPMDNFLVIQEDGLINEIYLVLGENEYVSINRTSGKTLTEDGMVDFAAKLAEIISGIVPLSVSQNTVPLPSGEDIVRSFFDLIEENRPSDAASMMMSDSEKQAWAVQFNAFTSMKIIDIEPAATERWTDSKQTYMLTLDVIMNPSSANAPIPYYGWNDGQNVRWVTIVKENQIWKIEGLATGP